MTNTSRKTVLMAALLALFVPVAASAQIMVLLGDDPTAVRRAVTAAKSQAPQVPILVRTRYLDESAELLKLGADHIVSEEMESGAEMTAWVLRSLGLDAPTVRTQLSRALVASKMVHLTDATGAWIEAVDRESQ